MKPTMDAAALEAMDAIYVAPKVPVGSFTIDDAVARWNCTTSAARSRLQRALDSGALESVKVGVRSYYYAPGKRPDRLRNVA